MRLVIIGAGGHSHVVSDAIAAALPDATIIGHLDDDPGKRGDLVLGRPVLGPIDSLDKHHHDGIVLAIGDNSVRAATYERLQGMERIIGVVHPGAIIAPSASLNPSAVVLAGAVINAAATVREDTIINTGATIDHQCVIGPHAHVAPGAHIAGGCVLGRAALVAMGAIVTPGRRIGPGAIVGAGAVVLDDIPEHVLAYGTPARVVRPVAR